jgi:hypothetical protein
MNKVGPVRRPITSLYRHRNSFQVVFRWRWGAGFRPCSLRMLAMVPRPTCGPDGPALNWSAQSDSRCQAGSTSRTASPVCGLDSY